MYNKPEILIMLAAIGFAIGAGIAKLHDWYLKTYGVDGKALIEKEMTEKYGEDWLVQMYNTKSTDDEI